MTEIIAFCGLACHECGAYLATLADDDTQRQEVAATWSQEYKADIQPKDINCLGCHSEGEVLFHHCQVCEIRLCGREMGVANCAHCQDYACSTLSEFFVFVPDAKERLDNIRQSL